MKLSLRVGWWTRAPIRFRLGLALALSLVPFLALGTAQSLVNYRLETLERRADLVAAAEDSAATVRAKARRCGMRTTNSRLKAASR